MTEKGEDKERGETPTDGDRETEPGKQSLEDEEKDVQRKGMEYEKEEKQSDKQAKGEMKAENPVEGEKEAEPEKMKDDVKGKTKTKRKPTTTPTAPSRPRSAAHSFRASTKKDIMAKFQKDVGE